VCLLCSISQTAVCCLDAAPLHESVNKTNSATKFLTADEITEKMSIKQEDIRINGMNTAAAEFTKLPISISSSSTDVKL
jgi:hypothetical protein